MRCKLEKEHGDTLLPSYCVELIATQAIGSDAQKPCELGVFYLHRPNAGGKLEFLRVVFERFDTGNRRVLLAHTTGGRPLVFFLQEDINRPARFSFLTPTLAEERPATDSPSG